MIPGSGGRGAQDADSAPGQGDSQLGAGDIGALASWRGPLTNSTDVTWAQGRNEEFQALPETSRVRTFMLTRSPDESYTPSVLRSAEVGSHSQLRGSIRTPRSLNGCVQGGRASRGVILIFLCAQLVGTRVTGLGMRPRPVSSQTKALGTILESFLSLTHQQILLPPC